MFARFCRIAGRWFPPNNGIGGYYEGVEADPEQEKHNVYRVDPKSGEIKVVVDDFVEPNGIAFSPDEKKLYVIDTGFTDGPENPSHIRVFDVDVGAGKLSNGGQQRNRLYICGSSSLYAVYTSVRGAMKP